MSDQAEIGDPALLHMIVNHMRDPVFYLTQDRVVAYGNPALEALMPGGETVDLARLIPDEDLGLLDDSLVNVRRAAESDSLQVRVRQLNEEAAASVRWYEIQLIPTGDGVLGVAHDIHEWKTREQRDRERERTSRMEAIGLLAGEVAHEFAHTMDGISGIASYALSEVDREDPSYADWETVHRAAQRGTELTRDLFSVAGKRLLTREDVDLAELLRSVAEDIRRMEPDIKVDLRIPDQPIKVKASPTQLHQVFRNLWANGRNAMEECSVPNPSLGLSLEVVDAEGIALVAIEDNGPGIPEEHLNRLFEPYFTTMEERGTGLGLSIAYGIVQKHGGVLSAGNRPGGGGTRMEVRIPLAA